MIFGLQWVGTLLNLITCLMLLLAAFYGKKVLILINGRIDNLEKRIDYIQNKYKDLFL